MKKEAKKESEELLNEQSRKTSIKEGSFASISQGTGHSYISPFAIALGANNMQIGILSSLPSIISPLSQLFGAKLIEKEKRKKIVIKYVFLESLMWIAILLIAILAYIKKINNLPIILIFLYSLLILIGNLASPSWFSWMGDIIPRKIRGRYFSKRNRISGIVTLISMLIASFFLDFFKTRGILLIGFAALFFIAFIGRTISAYLFTKQYEPKFKLKKGYYFSFFDFLKKAPENNFGKFALFICLIKFSTFIAAPFFAVYILRDLGLSYVWFTVISISASIFTLFSLPLWGKFSDKYGNRILLKIGSVLIPIVPILWIFSKNPLYLAIIPGLIEGIGWTAFNLGSTNFIYDTVTPQRRGICVAYYNLIVGIGIIIGGITGSILAQYLTITFMNRLLFIFLISGILRIIFGAIMIPKIKERRRVKRAKNMAIAIFKEMTPLHLHARVTHSPILFKQEILKIKPKN